MDSRVTRPLLIALALWFSLSPSALASGLCELKLPHAVIASFQVANGGYVAINEHDDPSDVTLTIINLAGPNSRVTATHAGQSLSLDLSDQGVWEEVDGAEQLRQWMVAAGVEPSTLEAVYALLTDECGFEAVGSAVLNATKEAMR